jgi:flagellar hook-associated protein 2
VVGPIRFDGVASGIDYTSIIERLLAVQRRPQEFLQAKIDRATVRKNAFLELNVSLLALKDSAESLSRPRTFGATRVSSSQEASVAASGSAVGAFGAFAVSVRRLAQAHQVVSQGHPDASATAVAAAAGSLSIEIGDGFLDRRSPVERLNGGDGYDRGSIRVTDASGSTALVDLSGASSVQDLVDAVNAAASVSVRASIEGRRLVLRDASGGAGALRVEDVGADATATSLGIAGTGVAVAGVSTLFGSDIGVPGESTPLAHLNDGLGVRRLGTGMADFTIVDTLGTAFDVTLQAGDDTIEEVVSRINAAATPVSSLRASFRPESGGLVLADAAGAGAISVAAAGGSFAAEDLGLGRLDPGGFVANASETALAGQELVGHALTPSLGSVLRGSLNGGRTRALASDAQGLSDGSLTITDRNGVSATVNVSRRVATTAAATAAGATSLSAASADGFAVGNRFRVRTASGLEYRTVTAISGTTVSFDRALQGAVSAGADLQALNDSLDDVVRTLNQGTQAAGVAVKVGLNAAKNGLRLVDSSGGPGTLSAAEAGGSVAAELGILGSTAASALSGTDLDVQYIGENTLLSGLNEGRGVKPGRFKITDRAGLGFTVDLRQADDTTIAEVIKDLNGAASAAGSALRARVNDTGDGLLLEDPGAGGGLVKVQELDGGRTARDLNLLGTATSAAPGQIDGSFEFRIAVSAGATLEDVAEAVNLRGIGVTASVLQDGSGTNPYRLALTGSRTGEAGRMTVTSDFGLSFSTTSQAQDALLLFGGGGGGTDPAVLRSSINTVTGALPGLTLDLKAVTSGTATVTVSRDTGGVAERVQTFVDRYNEAVKKIRDLASFDEESLQTGPLFSEGVVRGVRRDLQRNLLAPVAGLAGADLDRLSEIGITAGAEGTLALDAGALRAALDSRFEEVQFLFTLQRKLEPGTPLRDLNSGLGVTEANGADFEVTAQDGTVFTVDLAGASTVGALLQRINGAAGNGGRVLARISSDGHSLELVDSSGPVLNALQVRASGTSPVAGQLKILGTAPAGQNVLKGQIIGLQGDPGAAARLSEALDRVVRAGDGFIGRRIEALDASVKDFQESIEAVDKRLEALESRLVRRFSRLEAVIAQSQSTTSRLQALVSSLVGGNG